MCALEFRGKFILGNVSAKICYGNNRSDELARFRGDSDDREIGYVFVFIADINFEQAILNEMELLDWNLLIL